MKIQALIDSITSLLADFPAVSAFDNDPMGRFTSAVETKLLETLTQKMGANPARELSRTDVDDLITLQREWFGVIAGSDEIPCHAPRSRLTALILVLAQLIETAVGKSRYEILLPTVQTIDYEASGASVRDHDLQLTEFILTDDNKSMIEVLACLDCASESGELKHTFLDNGQVRQLSAAEKQRVINHSAEARAYWDAIQRKLNVTLRGESFGTIINRLCEALTAGGYSARGPGAGQDLNSGWAANVGIKIFFDWFNALSPQEQTVINRCSGYGGPLRDSLGRLARPRDANYTDTSYCVEVLSGQISSALQSNPQLYTTYPANSLAVARGVGLDRLEADVAAARARLDTAIKNPTNYRVTSTYGATAKGELELKIACFLSRPQPGVRHQEQERKEADDRPAQVYNRVFAQVSYRIASTSAALSTDMQDKMSEFDEEWVTTLLNTKTVDEIVAQLTFEITGQPVEPLAAEITRARHQDEIQRALTEHTRKIEAERRGREQQAAPNPALTAARWELYPDLMRHYVRQNVSDAVLNPALEVQPVVVGSQTRESAEALAEHMRRMRIQPNPITESERSRLAAMGILVAPAQPIATPSAAEIAARRTASIRDAAAGFVPAVRPVVTAPVTTPQLIRDIEVRRAGRAMTAAEQARNVEEVFNRVFAHVQQRTQGISARFGVEVSLAVDAQLDEQRIIRLLGYQTVDQAGQILIDEVSDIAKSEHERLAAREGAAVRLVLPPQPIASRPAIVPQPVIARPAIVPQAQVAQDFTAQRALMDSMRAGSRASIPQAPVPQPFVARPVPAVVPQAQAEATRQRQQVREAGENARAEREAIAAEARRVQRAVNLAQAAEYERNRP